MRKLTVVVIATLLATAFAGGDASAKAHRKHSVSKAEKTAPTQPVEKPATRLPVAPDTFRA